MTMLRRRHALTPSVTKVVLGCTLLKQHYTNGIPCFKESAIGVEHEQTRYFTSVQDAYIKVDRWNQDDCRKYRIIRISQVPEDSLPGDTFILQGNDVGYRLNSL